MTKQVADLRRRLHAAHCFIATMRFDAKDYGSTFSSSVYYSCRKFLQENRSIKEPRHVLISKALWIDTRRELLRLKKAPR